MSETVRDIAARSFWRRARTLTGVLLAVWLLINLLVPWFARDLSSIGIGGFRVGYWLAAQGALFLYLAIIGVYVLVIERMERRYLAEHQALDQPGLPGPRADAPPTGPG